MESLRVSLAQINVTVGDIENNIEKIISYIKKADDLGSDIIVFPELVITGYPPEDLLFKKHFVDDNLKGIKRIAKYASDITVIIGAVSKIQERLYNSAFILRNNKIIGCYNKINLPNYSVFDEKRYFNEGNDPLVFTIGKSKVGLNICEDIWHEDNVTDMQVKLGSKLIINLSASPFFMGKNERRRKILSKKARQLKTAIVYCNIVGGQDELVFDGASTAYNSQGAVVGYAGQFCETLLTVDIDVDVTKNSKKIKCLNLGEKRKALKPSLEKKCVLKNNLIQETYQALCLGTKDYVLKNGFSKVVIGLSGGIDSALTCAIAVDALGKENVIGVTMPSRFSSKETRSDAEKLARNFGIKFMEIPIEKVLTAYLGVLSTPFKDTKYDVTEENLQARIRGNILMSLSNKFGWLVLTTGNKSETSVGYCTLYGDMAGGFAVIKDVPKTLVYKLSEYINDKNAFESIPKSVIRRVPSAELKPNQKDSDSIPEYEILDPLIKYYVEEDNGFDEILKKTKCNADVLKDVIRRIDINEYKRRQSPPGIKITPKAFGKDRRLPITNKYIECKND